MTPPISNAVSKWRRETRRGLLVQATAGAEEEAAAGAEKEAVAGAEKEAAAGTHGKVGTATLGPTLPLSYPRVSCQ